MVPSFFHRALSIRNDGSCIVCQALCDAFLIAKRVANGIKLPSLRRTAELNASVSIPTSNPADWTVPPWFSLEKSVTVPQTEEARRTYIFTRDRLMSALVKMDVRALAKL